MGILVNRRRVMGTCGEKPLPYDSEIEYLESSGTQYIDTGIIPKNAICVEIGILYSSTQCTIIGGGNNWKAEFYIGRSSNSIIFNTNTSQGLRVLKGNSLANSAHVYKYDNGSCYIDDNLEGTNSPNIPSTSKTLCVLCYNRNAGKGEFTTGKLYFVKITIDGVLKRDLIPVRVGTTGYMYDMVSKQLFGNAGTGDFVLGSDKT